MTTGDGGAVYLRSLVFDVWKIGCLKIRRSVTVSFSLVPAAFFDVLHGYACLPPAVYHDLQYPVHINSVGLCLFLISKYFYEM